MIFNLLPPVSISNSIQIYEKLWKIKVFSSSLKYIISSFHYFQD